MLIVTMISVCSCGCVDVSRAMGSTESMTLDRSSVEIALFLHACMRLETMSPVETVKHILCERLDETDNPLENAVASILGEVLAIDMCNHRQGHAQSFKGASRGVQSYKGRQHQLREIGYRKRAARDSDNRLCGALAEERLLLRCC